MLKCGSPEWLRVCLKLTGCRTEHAASNQSLAKTNQTETYCLLWYYMRKVAQCAQQKKKDAPVLRLASTQWFSQNNRGTKSVSDAVLVWKFRLPQRANFDALRLPCLAPKMQVNERVLPAWNAWVVCLDELCVWCLSRQVCVWELFCASRCVHKRVPEKVPEKKIWKKNPEKVWEDFVQNQVRARGFRRRFGKRFGHALVQSQVRFNTVLENVLTFKPSKPAKPARPAKTSKLY